MASSGVMADFGRLSTERKVAVFAVIGVLLGLLYWKFIYSSLSEDLTTVDAEHDANVKKNEKLAADIPKFAELRTKMSKLQEQITKQQTALPSEAEVPAFFETLERKVTESGVEILKWTKRDETPVESFIKVPVEVEISGSFMQIKRFFASLVQADVKPAPGLETTGEEHERIVSIEHLAISQPTVKNREIVLDAKFVAVTYRQEDKPLTPVTPGKPGTPPAKAAPPPPPGGEPKSSAPPLPSAATPAGAKARTEDAMQKSDARNRGGGGVDEAKTPAPAGSDKLKGGM